MVNKYDFLSWTPMYIIGIIWIGSVIYNNDYKNLLFGIWNHIYFDTFMEKIFYR